MKIPQRVVAGMACCVLLLACATGCDFFRSLAGRPVSADIEAKRELIAREQAAHQARVDSLSRVEKAKADSLELLDRIREAGEMFLPASTLRRADLSSLDKRYYLIVGAFSSPENAAFMASKIEAEGYASARIPYGNGFTAVGVAGCDSLQRMWESLQDIRTRKFCPKDVWILVNEK